MSRNTATKWKVFGVSMILCLGLAILCFVLRVDVKNLDQVPLVELYRVLCDSFTIPGLLVLMFALLMSVSNAGALDGLGYVAVNGLKMLIPGAAAKMERFSEYLERRRANRVKNYTPLYATAAIFLAVSGIFLALFYTVFER